MCVIIEVICVAPDAVKTDCLFMYGFIILVLCYWTFFENLRKCTPGIPAVESEIGER